MKQSRHKWLIGATAGCIAALLFLSSDVVMASERGNESIATTESTLTGSSSVPTAVESNISLDVSVRAEEGVSLEVSQPKVEQTEDRQAGDKQSVMIQAEKSAIVDKLLSILFCAGYGLIWLFLGWLAITG